MKNTVFILLAFLVGCARLGTTPIVQTPMPLESYATGGGTRSVESLNSDQGGAGIPPTKLPQANEVLVVLDPGHGGEDLGALGFGNLLEKDLTLNISGRVKELLEKAGIPTFLTRNDDRLMSLSERTAIANSKQAQVFVSIHANASLNKSASGIETYYLDNSNDSAVKLLVQRENTTGGALSPSEEDLRLIISDLIQTGKLKDSEKLAALIQDRIPQKLKESNFEIFNRGVMKAPFYVLIGAHMPCVLVEVAYIDNESDGEHLLESNFRQKIAEGIAEAVEGFLKMKQGNAD